MDVVSIIPPGVDHHTYEPTPKEMERLTRASLWIRLGDVFDAKVHRALKAAKPRLNAVALLDDLAVIEGDVHIWLSPRLARDQAKHIARALCALLPSERTSIEKALEGLLQELDACDEKLRARLAAKEGEALLLSHPALGYFCRDYALVQLSLEREDKELRPKDLVDVLARIKEHPPSCVLLDPQHGNKGAKLIAKELQLKTHAFDPCAEDIIQNFHLLAEILSP